MHRSRGVIHRRRGVCGEAEVGHQILLAPFVAVIGAFAATAEVITDSCGKPRWQQTQMFWLAVNKNLKSETKNTPHSFLRTPILNQITKHGCSGHVFLTNVKTWLQWTCFRKIL